MFNPILRVGSQVPQAKSLKRSVFFSDANKKNGLQITADYTKLLLCVICNDYAGL